LSTFLLYQNGRIKMAGYFIPSCTVNYAIRPWRGWGPLQRDLWGATRALLVSATASLRPGYPSAMGFTKSIKFWTLSGVGRAVESCRKLQEAPLRHIPKVWKSRQFPSTKTSCPGETGEFLSRPIIVTYGSAWRSLSHSALMTGLTLGFVWTATGGPQQGASPNDMSCC
jgi:hypothetical protein